MTANEMYRDLIECMACENYGQARKQALELKELHWCNTEYISEYSPKTAKEYINDVLWFTLSEAFDDCDMM
jgi:hypothetical protein